jgi:RHS repeat-associated protein
MMKYKILLLLVINLLMGYAASAQLAGPTTVYTGVNNTYTYTGFVVFPTWQVSSNATIVSTTTTGSGYEATIRFNSGTTGWVTFKDKTIPLGTINTTIYCTGQPTPFNGTREEPGVVTLNSTIGANGVNNKWYTALTGGSLLITSQGYSPNVSVTTTFYVASVNSSGCESSPRLPVTATVTPKPVVQSTDPAINMGTTATLSVSNNTYTTYSWKRNGVVIGTGSTVMVTQPGTYTVTVTKTGMTGSGTSTPLVLQRTLDAQAAKNMVVVNRVLQDGITTEENMELLPVGPRQRSVSYFGGMGNTLQTIVSQGTPTKKDIVMPVGYDVHGRQLNGYLPYISSTDESKFRQHALANPGYSDSEQYGFYQATGQKIETDTKPYSVLELEPSPLGRAKSQTGPGSQWHDLGKKNVMEYLLNRFTDGIRLWKVSSVLPVSSTSYANYQLQVIITTDENGFRVRQYVDKLGRTVQKDVEKTTNTWMKTSYVYNDLGQLAFIISPEGVSKNNFSPNQTFLNQWAFQYKYDELGRLIEYRPPGGDWIYTVYDKLDRPLLKQDANLRNTASWAFIKYDQNGRAVLTGIKVIAGSTRSSVQTSVNNQTYMFELTDNTTTGYTLNRTYPTVAESELLTVAYYDNYAFLNYTGWDAESHNFSFIQELGHTGYSSRVAGLPTGGKVRMVGIGATTWLNAVQYYDPRYRPIQMLTENQFSGLDRTTIKYNNLKQAVEMKTTHTGGETVTVVRKAEYDHAGRIFKIFQNINSAPSDQLVAQYEYNELGQLVDKKLHNTGGSDFVQSVDFRYTIRGWLRSINNSRLTSDADNDETNDYFGMEILYNIAESGLSNTQLYNGGISAIKHKGPGGGSGTADQRSYKYAYDGANRLLTSTSQVHTGSAWTKEVGSQNENMTYDNNGNIKTLTRNQRKHQLSGVTASYVSEAIDNLTYTYASGQGNKLTKVEDATGRVEGFKNGVNVTTEFTYNNDGSLTADLNKGVSGITYNKLGKPETVIFTDGRKIEYTYTAAGEKLIMKNYQGTTLLLTTRYVGGFVYEDNTLKFFSSPEGRVVKNGSSFEYQYAIADHQGNTRVVFTSVTPEADDPETGFENSTSSDFGNYINRSSLSVMNRTPSGTYSQLLNGGYNSQVGATRSIKVYPGDKVKAEAHAKYWNTTSTTGNLTGFAAALAGAFGVSSSSTGEGAQIFEALDAFGAFIAGGDRPDDDNSPKGFITILLFDKEFNFLDAAWEQLDEDYAQTGIETNYPFDHLIKEVTVKEEGYAFVFVSNENATQVDIHFDDLKVTHTKSNVIQYNEYYPFGLQSNTSWTRENTYGNNYLYNEGSELNPTSGWYEMFYRGYDPALGRMFQVDPYATVFASITPYNYAGNSPLNLNDPSGGYASWYGEFQQWSMENTIPKPLFDEPDLGWYGHSYLRGPGSANHWANGIGTSGWTLNGSAGGMIYNPWGGNHYRGNYYEGVWLALASYEGQVFYQNKYGADPRVVIREGREASSLGHFNYELAGEIDLVANSILGITKEGFTITHNQIKKSNYWLQTTKNTTSIVAKNLKFTGYVGIAAGVVISGFEVWENGGSHSAWARLGTNVAIAAIGFIPYVGLPLAIGLGSYEAAGGFDKFYQSFDDPITRALYLQGLVFNNPFMFTGNTFK